MVLLRTLYVVLAHESSPLLSIYFCLSIETRTRSISNIIDSRRLDCGVSFLLLVKNHTEMVNGREFNKTVQVQVDFAQEWFRYLYKLQKITYVVWERL